MDWSQILHYLPGLAQAGMGGYQFMDNSDPTRHAMGYLNQIPSAMQPYFQPYMQAGQGALSDLEKQYGALTGNTSDVYNKLASGYQQSPGYQRALQEALNASGNAAAAGGMLGTPMHQQQDADIAARAANQDFGDYMARMMGLYGQGLTGQQALGGLGYNAAANYGISLGNNLGQQAQYAFGGDYLRNIRRNSAFNNIFGGLGSLFGGK